MAKHWTQTAEGRRRMRKLSRKRHANEKLNGQAEPPDVTFALGYVQAWLDTYASRAGVSAPTLAYRVGQLLQRTARR